MILDPETGDELLALGANAWSILSLGWHPDAGASCLRTWSGSQDLGREEWLRGEVSDAGRGLSGGRA